MTKNLLSLSKNDNSASRARTFKKCIISLYSETRLQPMKTVIIYKTDLNVTNMKCFSEPIEFYFSFHHLS